MWLTGYHYHAVMGVAYTRSREIFGASYCFGGACAGMPVGDGRFHGGDIHSGFVALPTYLI